MKTCEGSADLAARYRAGLIGCGGMSQAHATALQAMSGVELVALCDIDEGRLRQAGERHGVSALYRHYDQMLAREGLDLVTVCTQAPVHAPATIAAAEAGARGILCEKPIALDLAQADRMIAVCDRRRVKLAINHQLRISPGARRARELFDEGAIGELLAIRMVDKGGRPAGNSLMEIGTHLFDLACVYGGDVAWAWAQLAVSTADGTSLRPATAADIKHSQVAWPHDRDCGLVVGERCLAVFGFQATASGRNRGAQGTYQTFFQPPGARWTTSMEVVGLEGVLALRSAGEGALDVYLHRGPWGTPGRFEPVLVGEDSQPVPSWGVAMLTDLIGAIEEDRDPRSSGRTGRAALEMVMGVFEAHRRGAAVALPLADRRHPLGRWREES